jgi:hypothetical protein
MGVKRLEDSPLVLRRPQAAIIHIGSACRRYWGPSTKNSLLGESIHECGEALTLNQRLKTLPKSILGDLRTGVYC